MATNLSKTTSLVRRLVFFGVIAVIVLWILQSTTHILDPIIKVTPSVRPNTTSVSYGNCPTPNQSFGKIPKLQLSSYALAAGTKAKFSVDKTKFPDFPATLNVYKLNKMYEKLDDVDRVSATVETLGFNPDAIASEGTIVRWQSEDELKVFSFDKATHIWEMITNLNNTPLTYLNGSINQYITIAANVIKSIKVSNSNYVGYEVAYELILRKFDRTFESVSNLSKANMIKYTYFKTLDAIACKTTNGEYFVIKGKVLSPDYKDPSFVAYLTGNGTNLTTNLLSISLREFDLSSTPGIYPSITMDEAYSLLQENKGTLYWIMTEGGNSFAKYTELKVTEFLINVDQTKIIYLEPQKYIDDNETTFYLQPYYQFSGKATLNGGTQADFIFLIPALKTEEYK